MLPSLHRRHSALDTLQSGELHVGFSNIAETPDVLADLAKDFPQEVASFLQATFSLGCLSSVVPLFSSLVVGYNWSTCGCCNRPLMPWIVVHCVLHMLQLPLRVSFLKDLHVALHQDADMCACVHRVTTGIAWKINTVVSILAYAWLVLGMVWIIHAGSCQLSWLCMFLVGITVGKFLLTWLLFRYLVPQTVELPYEFNDADQQQQGAPWEFIDSLPIVKYPPGPFDEVHETDTCIVCLCDFEGGQLLRKLPCGHIFHQGCIDKWLSRRKVCPLCLQDVESAPQSSTQELKKGV